MEFDSIEHMTHNQHVSHSSPSSSHLRYQQFSDDDNYDDITRMTNTPDIIYDDGARRNSTTPAYLEYCRERADSDAFRAVRSSSGGADLIDRMKAKEWEVNHRANALAAIQSELEDALAKADMDAQDKNDRIKKLEASLKKEQSLHSAEIERMRQLEEEHINLIEDYERLKAEASFHRIQNRNDELEEKHDFKSRRATSSEFNEEILSELNDSEHSKGDDISPIPNISAGRSWETPPRKQLVRSDTEETIPLPDAVDIVSPHVVAALESEVERLRDALDERDHMMVNMQKKMTVGSYSEEESLGFLLTCKLCGLAYEKSEKGPCTESKSNKHVPEGSEEEEACAEDQSDASSFYSPGESDDDFFHDIEEEDMGVVLQQVLSGKKCTLEELFDAMEIDTSDKIGRKRLRSKLADMEANGKLLVNIRERGSEVPRCEYFMQPDTMSPARAQTF
eukprot:m.313592 g.313592  ORF g.313592 m.313592 type:complete len:451 (-) comp16491_c8_seq3:125-1477(-)